MQVAHDFSWETQALPEEPHSIIPYFQYSPVTSLSSTVFLPPFRSLPQGTCSAGVSDINDGAATSRQDTRLAGRWFCRWSFSRRTRAETGRAWLPTPAPFPVFELPDRYARRCLRADYTVRACA